jgi:hypothetical protein
VVHRLIWPTSAAEMELPVLRDQKVRPVHKVPLVRKDFKDHKGFPVLMELKVFKVLKDHKGYRATLALRACRAFKDRQETMERKDFREQMGLRDHKVRKGQPAGLSLSKAER